MCVFNQQNAVEMLTKIKKKRIKVENNKTVISIKE